MEGIGIMEIEVGEERILSSGDLAELYGQHAQAGLRFAYVLVADQHQAEDLLQDAFAKVARRPFALRDPQAFGGYLRRAIVNLHFSRLRRLRLERSHLATEAARGTANAHQAPDVATREDLWKVLLLLPQRQRAALYLRYYEDRSEADTAAALGCSRGAAKQLVLRAVTTLRQQMGEESHA